MSSSDSPVKRVDRTIWLWGFLYFVAYTPYAGLVKAMSAGKLPGLAGIDGLELLPPVLAGTLVTLPIYVLLMGWWRYARVPSWPVVLSGFGTALIIATTTLAYALCTVYLAGGMSNLWSIILVILAFLHDLAWSRRRISMRTLA